MRTLRGPFITVGLRHEDMRSGQEIALGVKAGFLTNTSEELP